MNKTFDSMFFIHRNPLFEYIRVIYNHNHDLSCKRLWTKVALREETVANKSIRKVSNYLIEFYKILGKHFPNRFCFLVMTSFIIIVA